MEEEKEIKNDNNFWFKFANLDVELFANKNLNKIDCLIFAMIELKDSPKKHCFASNEYFAKLLKVTTTTISTSISNLKKHGYIEDVMFDGRKRTIKVKNNWKNEHSNLLLEMINSQEEFNKPSNQTLNNHKGSIKEDLKDIIIENNKRLKKENSFSKEKESRSDERQLSGSETIQKPKLKLNRRIPEQMALSKSPQPLSKFNTPSPSNPDEYRKHIKKGIKKLSAPPPISEDRLTPEMQAVVDHWESLGLFISSETAKTHKEGLQKLRRLFGGQLLFDKKYTVEEVNDSISRFRLSVQDPNYLPQDKNKLTSINLNKFISDGFTNPFSRFQTYLSPNEPKPIIPILENKYPEIVNKLKQRYYHDILGAIVSDRLSPKDENDFIEASIKLIEFWVKNKSKMIGEYRSSEKADFLFDAVKNAAMGNLSIITPGWFKSSNTFTKRLPAYLQQERITKSGADDGGNGSGYNYGQKYNISNESEQEETIISKPIYDFDTLPTRRPKDIKIIDPPEDFFSEEESLADRLKRIKKKIADNGHETQQMEI